MEEQAKSTSVLAITGLVAGIAALLTSFLPIINNISALVALVGLVCGVVGLVGIVRGKKQGKGLAIAAVIINVLSLVVVLATQSMYSAAIDEAMTTDAQLAESGASGQGDAANTEAEATQSTENLAVGVAITTEDGLTVSVDAIETGVVGYDGNAYVKATVTYSNAGSGSADYNEYSWKGEDANGAQEYAEVFMDADYNTDDAALGYGSLAAGGTKTGTMYFKDGTSKLVFFANTFDSEATASWVVA